MHIACIEWFFISHGIMAAILKSSKMAAITMTLPTESVDNTLQSQFVGIFWDLVFYLLHAYAQLCYLDKNK
jgi:hypothetical protein